MANAQDEAFMSQAASRGLVSQKAAEQARAHGRGHEPLSQTLMRVGLIAPSTAEALLTDLRKLSYVCNRCRTRVRYDDLARLPRLACTRCGDGLILENPNSGLSNSLGSGSFPEAESARTFGAYSLIEELGRGCMGVVYRARKAGLARDFALKVMLGEQDDEGIKRFKQEAQLASKLEDPGVIGVFDVGVSGGHHYYVMDYCPGPTLQEHLAKKGGRLESDEAARILEQVARTVHHAHERQVVHRDLKPANIILDPAKQRPRITDFGLAKDYDRIRSLTQTGDVLGTPYYMSPEQFRGEDIDARVDVWALGVMLYELVTGARPFEGSNHMELGDKVERRVERRPRELVPDLSEDLEAICLCAIATDRDDRYLTAQAFAEDLEAFLRGESPTHASGVMLPRRRAGPGLKAFGVAVALSLVAVGGVFGARFVLGGAEGGGGDGDSAAKEREAARLEAQKKQALAAREALSEARRLCREGGDAVEAAGALARAIELAADGSDLQNEAKLERVSLLLTRGHPAEAIETATPLRLLPKEHGWEATRLVAEAQEFLADRVAARQTYSQLRQMNPGGVRGLTAAAAIKRLDADWPDALALASRAIARDATYPAAAYEYVFALQRSDPGDPRARPALDRALARMPSHPRLLYLLAALESSRSKDSAFESLDRAVELSGEHPEPRALRMRGALAGALGRLDEGLEDLNRAIELDPGNARHRFQRGRLRWMKSKEDWTEPRWLRLAQTDLREAESLSPEELAEGLRFSGGGFARVARVLLGRDVDWDPADIVLTPRMRKRIQARVKGAQRAGRQALLKTLLVAAQGGAWSEVEPLLLEAKEAAPECPVIALEGARLAVGREAYELAAKEIARARSLGGPENELDLLEGHNFWLMGQAYKAAPFFERLAARDRHSSVGLCARAWFHFAHDQNDAALKAAKRAMNYDPEHVPSLYVRALTLNFDMQPTEAEPIADRAMALDGAIDLRPLRAKFSARNLLLFFGESGKPEPNKMLDIGAVKSMVEGFERAFPLNAGTGFLLDAAQNVLRIRGPHPWYRHTDGWLDQTEKRLPGLGMTHVLRGRLRIQTRARKDVVLELWRKAREVEPRIKISEQTLELYREVYGGPCPELSEFEPK